MNIISNNNNNGNSNNSNNNGLASLPLRGWRNTVEVALLEISNSMKPYASVFHAYTGKLRPNIHFVEPNISTRFQTMFR